MEKSSTCHSIDDALRQGVEDGAVAGVVAMGADRHGPIYEGAFGLSDLAQRTPISADSIVWLLSMTKAITAVACMQLVDRGLIDLDQPAGDFLPALGAPLVLTGFGADARPLLRPARRAITVRHLLTHTSGHGYSIWNADLARYEQVTGMPNIAYSLNGAFDAPLVADPGERWEYGIGIDWIGKLVEAVTNQSLEVYFREHIFAPLGMRDTGFLISSAQRRRLVTMYVRQPDGALVPAPFEINQRPEFFMGGGGLFSTPRDYMRFLGMLLNEGEYDGERILQAQTVEAMFRNQIGELGAGRMRTAQPQWSADVDLQPGAQQQWGLGFALNTAAGANGRQAGSGAWAGLLNSYFWIDPKQQVAGAVFTQLLPFFDARALALFGQFERGMYRAVAAAHAPC